MHLLYLDDSGSSGNTKEEYLVLGGVSVNEAQIHWITTELDTLAERFDAANPYGVEFHASEIFARRTHPWKGRTKGDAREIIKSVLRVLEEAYQSARAFACVVHKGSFLGKDPMEIAFEDLCSRFDQYLQRLSTTKTTERGLLIIDKSTHETTLQQLSLSFRTLGNRWGSTIRHIAETPLFLDSKASRVVQLADHVAYSVFRRYQHGDTNYLDIIGSRFDSVDGIIHGLAHKEMGKPNCSCIACISRLPG